jgi:Holliday junction resolvase RusA-like endonuclease
MIKLVIRDTLPDLNDHIKALSANRYKGGRLKKNTDEAIMWQLKCQLAGVKIKPPVRMHYLWVEPNMKRDLDNIAFARKYIQDALVKLGALANDGWAYISGFSDEFAVDSKNPRIEIEIEEAAQ